MGQLKRQSDAQLEAAAEARRAETRRADSLAAHLSELQAKVLALESRQQLPRSQQTPSSSQPSSSQPPSQLQGLVAGAGAEQRAREAERASVESQMSAELQAMAGSHRQELAAKERAAAAALEREIAHRERALASLEARFAEERAELQRGATRVEVRARERWKSLKRRTRKSFRKRAEAAEEAAA